MRSQPMESPCRPGPGGLGRGVRFWQCAVLHSHLDLSCLDLVLHKVRSGQACFSACGSPVAPASGGDWFPHSSSTSPAGSVGLSPAAPDPTCAAPHLRAPLTPASPGVWADKRKTRDTQARPRAAATGSPAVLDARVCGRPKAHPRTSRQPQFRGGT